MEPTKVPLSLEEGHLANRELLRQMEPEDKLRLMQSIAETLNTMQRNHKWWIGDLVRIAIAEYGDAWHNVFPVEMSPGLLTRDKAVAEAYPQISDRNLDATWTIHMRLANKPNRQQLVAEHVDAGHTSDEAHQTQLAKPSDEKRTVRKSIRTANTPWLLAVDTNVYLHRAYRGPDPENAAETVVAGLRELIDYLQLERGLTDAVICFDHPKNHRKTLADYKPRPPKEEALKEQLKLVQELAAQHFAVHQLEGMEADDLLASYAAQFDGHVSLLTIDKDLRQCFSEKCNMLLDYRLDEALNWVNHEHHVQTGLKYSGQHVHGIYADQWVDFQCLAGDSVDGVPGAAGIGPVKAMQLIKNYGTIDEIFVAAAAGELSKSCCASIIAFQKDSYQTTRQLVTLRTDLPLNNDTSLKD